MQLKKYEGINSLERKLVTFLIERIDVVDCNNIQVTYRFEKEISEMEQFIELCGRKEAV
jgi:hypothetical protein